MVAVDSVGSDEMILDIGPRSIEHVCSVLARIKTLVWNGPFGAFELEPFDIDTVAALNAAGAAGRFTYVSTAGGAFLEWLEGKPLPGGRSAQGQITVAFLPSAHGGWSAMKKGAPENQQQCGVDSPRTSRKTIRSFKSRCMAALRV